MGKERHLQRRGGSQAGGPGRLYFRLKIPKDVQRHFDGKRELKRSLRTVRYNDAKPLVRSEVFRAERLFTQIRGGLMDRAEIRELVANYFEDTLADAEDARADGSGVLGEDIGDGRPDSPGGHNEALEGLELNLTDLVEDLARGKHGAAAGVADSILEGAGITLDKSSTDYKILCREALKGAIAATKVNLARMRGHYTPPQAGRASSTPAVAPPVAPDVPPILLSEALAEFVKEHAASGRWREKTREETEGVYRLLVGIVGDRDISELDFKVLSQFREDLSRFPSNHTKRPAYRGKTISEIRELTRKVKAASPLSVSSVNKHIIRTGAFLKWAMKRGYVAANYAEGLTVVRKGKPSGDREAYSTEDLLRLVQSPLARFKDTRPERYWVPILGLYTGARLNELCQLHLEDVREVDGIACIDINSAGEKTLKNVGTERVVPVHPFLLDLGFGKYVDAMRRATPEKRKGVTRLWPNLKMKRGGFGDDFSKWYQRWNRKYVTGARKRVFHSLRGNFTTALLNAKAEDAVVSALIGHAHGTMTVDRYHKGYSVAVLFDALKRLEYGVEGELRKLAKPPSIT